MQINEKTTEWNNGLFQYFHGIKHPHSSNKAKHQANSLGNLFLNDEDSLGNTTSRLDDIIERNDIGLDILITWLDMLTTTTATPTMVTTSMYATTTTTTLES